MKTFKENNNIKITIKNKKIENKINIKITNNMIIMIITINNNIKMMINHMEVEEEIIRITIENNKIKIINKKKEEELKLSML